MAIKVLQWNMNGYTNNYNQLQLLIHDTNADIICIQETHFPSNTLVFPTPKSYTDYFFNLHQNTNAKRHLYIG